MEKEEESLEWLEKGQCKGGYGNPRPKGSMAKMAQGPKGKAKDNNNASSVARSDILQESAQKAAAKEKENLERQGSATSVGRKVT